MALWAYEFICGRSWEDLHAALNAIGPWTWEEGDSAWYGDYLRYRPFPGVHWRIHDIENDRGERRRYNADVRFGDDCRVNKAVVDQAFRDLLAKLPAEDVQEIESYD